MPAKNTILQAGKRFNIVKHKLWKEFMKETGIELPYIEFSIIISETNLAIKDKVTTNLMGFKAPEGFGYWVVTKFKCKRRALDFKRTKENGANVYHTNFHSHGYSHRVQWITAKLSDVKFIGLYKFKADRGLSREVAKKVISEKKIYNEQGFEYYKKRGEKFNIDKKMQKYIDGKSKGNI